MIARPAAFERKYTPRTAQAMGHDSCPADDRSDYGCELRDHLPYPVGAGAWQDHRDRSANDRPEKMADTETGGVW